MLLDLHSAAFSVEFFPPCDEAGNKQLQQNWQRLSAAHPWDFFSVTFGAAGSSRGRTLQTIQMLRQSGQIAAPHISCVGLRRQDIDALMQQYRHHDIRHLVVLRGDLPSGQYRYGELAYADALIALIRKHSGSHFDIKAAAYPEYHPQSPSPEADIMHLKQKVDAGVNSLITQYFYSSDSYFYFRDRCQQAGITVPIVPGIMPISNYARLQRFSQASGAEIPAWMHKLLTAKNHDATVLQEIAADIVARLCHRLLAGGAPGLHFYTLNRALPTLNICQRLGLIKHKEKQP